jgi:hypothetical protein
MDLVCASQLGRRHDPQDPDAWGSATRPAAATRAAPAGGGAAEVERLHRQHGFRAVRFNPYLWPEGEKMTNEVRQDSELFRC